MRNVEWIEMLKLIPEEQQNTLALVLRGGSEIMVEMFHRYEPNFLVVRGRLGGTTDEGRAFFVPYDEMLYYRIERVVKLDDLKALCDPDGAAADAAATKVTAPVAPPTLSGSTAPPNLTPSTSDPATMLRQNLLERIRAARASTARIG